MMIVECLFVLDDCLLGVMGMLLDLFMLEVKLSRRRRRGLMLALSMGSFITEHENGVSWRVWR